MNKKHLGSNFDDFLREEQLLDSAEITAITRVIAFQIEREMKRRKLSKSEMATRMKTSRVEYNPPTSVTCRPESR